MTTGWNSEPGRGAGMTPVRVLVVDDSRAMRALLRACLERDPGVRVVAEAGDPYEARAAIKPPHPTSSSSTSTCRRWTASPSSSG